MRLIPILNSVIVLHFQNTASYGLFGTAFQSSFMSTIGQTVHDFGNGHDNYSYVESMYL